VFLARSNGHKGRLFCRNTAMTQVKFNGFNAGDEQLLAAREIGFIFPYMNTDTV
jgi:chitinase